MGDGPRRLLKFPVFELSVRQVFSGVGSAPARRRPSVCALADDNPFSNFKKPVRALLGSVTNWTVLPDAVIAVMPSTTAVPAPLTKMACASDLVSIRVMATRQHRYAVAVKQQQNQFTVRRATRQEHGNNLFVLDRLAAVFQYRREVRVAVP